MAETTMIPLCCISLKYKMLYTLGHSGLAAYQLKHTVQPTDMY